MMTPCTVLCFGPPQSLHELLLDLRRGQCHDVFIQCFFLTQAALVTGLLMDARCQCGRVVVEGRAELFQSALCNACHLVIGDVRRVETRSID